MKTLRLVQALGLLSALANFSVPTFANEPPVSSNLTKTLKEDKPIKIALKAKDPERKRLTFTITQLPQHGGITLRGSNVTYIPQSNYYGSDSFQFASNDGELTSAPATVNLTVQAVNDAPTVVAQNLTVQRGATATITLKASDIENDLLKFQISTKPKAGNVIGKPVGNTVTYTPRKATYDKKGKLKKPDFTGADSFSVKAKDRKSSSKAVKIKLTVSDSCPSASQTFKKGVCVTSCTLPEIFQNDTCIAPQSGYETLSVTKIGKGTVSSAPTGIDCGSTCAAFFPLGSAITLTATSDANSAFIGWNGGGCGASPTCTVSLNNESTQYISVTADFTPRFNDTGITTCSDNTNNGLGCPLNDFPGQDADFGRDNKYNDDSNGHAGFIFTKIGSSGIELPVNAASWDCVKDNVTGLMWEIKTKDGGLHDMNKTFSWNEAAAYAQEVNAAGWCGYTDWRVPTRKELISVADLSRINPAIDSDYFPNTDYSTWFWTSIYAPDSTSAWVVGFSQGDSNSDFAKSTRLLVRLVRDGQ